MCQIFAGPSAKVRSTLLNTATLLEALFDSNSDGWGAMYHTTSGIKAIKRLPRSVEDTRKYVEALPNDDRPVAVHWRMRTSGKIDTHNAHPHEAEGGYVIHNGVLRDVDMRSNPDLCDTIHFCRQYLDGNIDAIVRSERLQRMVGEFIGNNRFVILSADGQMCIVNKDQGYEVNGVWVANTYASPPELLIPEYRSYKGTYFGSYSDDRDAWWTGTWGATTPRLDDELDDNYKSWLEDVVLTSMENIQPSDMAEVMEDTDTARHVINFILDNFTLSKYTYNNAQEKLPSRVELLRSFWLTGVRTTLVSQCRNNAAAVVEALLYYCNWTPKQDGQPGTATDTPKLALVA